MRALIIRSAIVFGLVASAVPAAAQVDPLLFMKTAPPNVLLVVDTGNRMQRDAPSDPANPRTTSTYYDPITYPLDATKLWQATIGVTPLNTTAAYRRKYVGLDYLNGADKYSATTISVVHDRDVGYNRFLAPTRLAIARAALYLAVSQNSTVARFGLVKMRQTNPAVATSGNSGPVADADVAQATPTETGNNGRWNVSRPTVGNTNNGATAASGVLIKADTATANADVMKQLAMDVRGAWQGPGAAPNPLPAPLLPTGSDDAAATDTPVN